MRCLLKNQGASAFGTELSNYLKKKFFNYHHMGFTHYFIRLLKGGKKDEKTHGFLEG